MQSSVMSDGPRPVVRSPAVSPSRPLSVRHLSSDITTYIDLYGLDQSTNGRSGEVSMDASDNYTEDDFLSSGDVDQELKNLQNLRRISLDVSKMDPDVPSQNYELSPALSSHAPTEESDASQSLYWVPARIHPELAPQEWQSFVQKKEFRSENQIHHPASLGRGLSRSKSLLSREVNERAADKYTDAGPELERRRSKLRPSINVPYLSPSLHGDGGSINSGEIGTESSIPEEIISGNASDEPILVPPPGQILRRAARTGKAKGSYRKFAKPKAPELTTSDLENVPAPTSPSSAFESETIQLRADAPGYVLSTTSGHAPADETAHTSDAIVERKKSRNRTIQIVGPKSPIESASTVENIVMLPHTTELEGQQSEPDVRASVQRAATNISEQDPVDSSSLALSSANLSNAESVSQTANLVSIPTGQDPRLARDLSHSQVKPVATTEHSSALLESPKHQSPRPGLKRELSAASLTRAVMSGTAPMPTPITNKSSRAEEQLQDGPAAMTSHGKKSAWNKLFSSDDRDKSKNKKEVKSTTSKMKRSPSQEEKTSHEKEAISTNIFTSIFGAKKKEKEVAVEPIRRETTPTPRAIVREPQFYSRYPIQLERAIYRMAHLKLGNSRRPLFHQVLLSNFMYGYLALVGANTSGQATGPSSTKRNRNQGTMQRSSSARDEAEARSNSRGRVISTESVASEVVNQGSVRVAGPNNTASVDIDSSTPSQSDTRPSHGDRTSIGNERSMTQLDGYANKENTIATPQTTEKHIQRPRQVGQGQRSINTDIALQQQ